MTECYVGEIASFAHDKIPRGWLPCDGRTLPVQGYTALFSLLSVTYGGDGRTNFRLPDLRGRTPLGMGTRGSFGYGLGEYGGQETVTLTAANLPAHTHSLIADATNSASVGANNSYFAQVVTSAADSTPQLLYAPPGSGPAVPLNPASVSTVGAAAPHNNMQPFLTICYCIATSGTYPPRDN